MTHITIQRSVVETILEVLQWSKPHEDAVITYWEAIAAIKAALAQPTSGEYALGYAEGFNDACKPKPAQQEPVAWIDIDEKGGASGLRYWSEPDNRHEVALYTTSPQRTWVGLTDREKSNLWLESRAAIPRFHTYATLAEAKLKEKNT